jgi:hypothetical protein
MKIAQFCFFFLVLMMLFVTAVYPQSTNAPLSSEYYHLLDRYEIRKAGFAKHYFSSFKPVQRKAIAEFAAEQLDSISSLSKVDHFNLQFLTNDNWEWTRKAEVERNPCLKIFYKRKPALYSVHIPEFDLQINPVVHLEGGIELDKSSTYINTRGLELRAKINQKVGFYSLITENQARLPGYVRERIREQSTVPGEGFYKGYKDGGIDFFHARGYVSINPVQNIHIQFGQDKFFIGNGKRSLILSDFGTTYPFLKFQTQIWRFSYTNLFAELRGNFPGRANNPSDIKKFLALHHLSLNLSDNVNIGFFEALISGDSIAGGFHVEYLNPVIFYRAIEHYANSNTSNALVGIDWKWNFLRHFQLYGQFVLDEFLLAHLRDETGWWANKWASQLGVKYVDALAIRNLDIQLEWNRARPFIYSHESGYTNYTHYLQPLAHPHGANFDEKLLNIRYQPVKRLQIEAQYLNMDYGRDSLKSNVGNNIFLNYNNRSGEFGHKIGQGLQTNLKIAQVNISFMLAHRMYIELTQTLRQYASSSGPEENSFVTTIGMRWNMGRREYLF